MPIKFPTFRPRREDYPADLWTKCPSCQQMHYNKVLEKALLVCPDCGYHHRLAASDRIAQLVDPGSFAEHDAGLSSVDALGFVDARPYGERLASAQAASGLRDAAIWGTAAIAGQPIALVVMDFGFMGGSMGAVVGEKVARAAEAARSERLPLIIVSASGGARMQEGTLSLMQLAKTMAALERLREAGVPYISVLGDPTTGGVFASFASMGDVNIAEPNALIGFAGARVSAGTIGDELPPGFQRSDFVLAHGFVDRVVSRADLRDELARLLRLLTVHAQEADAEPIERPVETALRPIAAIGATIAELVGADGRPREDGTTIRTEGRLSVEATSADGAWERVVAARDTRRPRTLDLIRLMADEWVELSGDRHFGDDPAMIVALASMGGRRVLLVGQQKGADTEENIRRNFGMPHPEGYRKAMRGMELAERLGLPVVALIDVPGAHPGPESEERGIAESIARSIGFMTRLRTPIVAVITGEGGSGGALAIAVGDVVLALENAVYSVISPEGCAAILWRDAERAPAAAAAMRMTAAEQRELGVVDEVVPEPDGGAPADHAETARRLREAILARLEPLMAVPVDELLEARYQRYRRLGAFAEEVVPAAVPAAVRVPGLADRLRGLIGAGGRTIVAPVGSALRSRDEPPALDEV
jgi:acetyl-CoA carboxylase carboxyl transferase subunit beta